MAGGGKDAYIALVRYCAVAVHSVRREMRGSWSSSERRIRM